MMPPTHDTPPPPLRITPELLEYAYRQGIFPMGDPETGEINWYQPEPRTILDLEAFHVPRRLAKTLRSGKFQFSINQAFREVMTHCARTHEDPEQIWITPEIIEIYCEMHVQGKAHSVEAWCGGQLAGGLYGIALGGAFMGESMFHVVRDASKASLAFLVHHLRTQGFTLLDTQFPTDHLAQFGIEMIPHTEYLLRLHEALDRTWVRFVPEETQSNYPSELG
jgi:leucyl/phenylalanyl-tRNA--protein transferase